MPRNFVRRCFVCGARGHKAADCPNAGEQRAQVPLYNEQNQQPASLFVSALLGPLAFSQQQQQQSMPLPGFFQPQPQPQPQQLQPGFFPPLQQQQQQYMLPSGSFQQPQQPQPQMLPSGFYQQQQQQQTQPQYYQGPVPNGRRHIAVITGSTPEQLVQGHEAAKNILGFEDTMTMVVSKDYGEEIMRTIQPHALDVCRKRLDAGGQVDMATIPLEGPSDAPRPVHSPQGGHFDKPAVPAVGRSDAPRPRKTPRLNRPNPATLGKYRIEKSGRHQASSGGRPSVASRGPQGIVRSSRPENPPDITSREHRQVKQESGIEVKGASEAEVKEEPDAEVKEEPDTS